MSSLIVVEITRIAGHKNVEFQGDRSAITYPSSSVNFALRIFTISGRGRLPSTGDERRTHVVWVSSNDPKERSFCVNPTDQTGLY